MAETRLKDCPICKRANVVGYRNDKKQLVEGGGAAYGALVGAGFAGPVGALVGGLIGKFAGNLIMDAGEGKVEYKFKCPNCSHEWTGYFPK